MHKPILANSLKTHFYGAKITPKFLPSKVPILKISSHPNPPPAPKMQQLLTHLITTNTPLTLPPFIKLINLSPSPHSHLPLLFTQFKQSITTDLCTSLIKSFASTNQHLCSILAFAHMHKASLNPDPFAFPPLLKSISQLNLPGLGRSLHCFIVRLGLTPDTFLSTALVSMYSSFSQIDSARKAFDEMPYRNSVSWNAMITGFVHNRRFREAHELFSEMLCSGYEPGEVTMVGALSACAHLGALNQGVWIHNYIDRVGIRVNVFVGTALVDMYMKCGAVEEAVRAFRSMRFKNVFTWNVLISGFAMNGRGEMAMEAFDAMMTGERVKPDGVTFLAVLCACCHQGFVDKGRMIFDEMAERHGVRPKLEHYGCMVDLLGRAGFLEEAEELTRTMPMEPDAVIWRALLAACRIHGNARLGEHAIRKLLELEPDNGENYVLLANIMARERRWSELGEVREVMSKERIGKVPGCSSIEVGNAVHEFVVTSRTDEGGEFEEIFAMLDDMNGRLKAAGYLAETDMVSYDLEEEEKEGSLMYHSEKLALAFGLLRTPRGSVVRIVKNLRVCRDCHAFFKLVSSVYEREIVVRDRNRFHHFGGGVCSCRDYW